MAKKKPEEPAHGESWLVSYCDMISLLCTFFLMMMTFSTKDKLDVREAGVGILNGRGGIWKNMMSMPQHHEVNQSMLSALSRDLAALSEEMGDNGAPAAFERLDGLTLSFNVGCSFGPGSAEVNDTLRRSLEQLGASLANYRHLILVEGHADDRFQPTPAFETAEAISAERAWNACAILLKTGGIAKESIQVAGLGTSRPRALNSTPLGRTANRRVELTILALSRPESAHGESGPIWKGR